MINKIINSIACFLSTFLNTNAITYSKIITAVMIIASIYNTISKLYGHMLELIPNMNNKLKVGFYNLENDSIHNTNCLLRILSCYDLIFFITNNTLSEFEKYAFGKLIERHVKNNKYKDYNISISECLYIKDDCNLLNKVYEYSQFYYDDRVKNYFRQDNINYSLTKEDIERIIDG